VEHEIVFDDSKGFAGIPELDDLFAARWTGTVYVEDSGDVAFQVQAEGLARLFIDETLVLDKTGVDVYGEAEGAISLDAGSHDLRVEFVENLSSARVTLLWDPDGDASFEPIPRWVLMRRDIGAAHTDDLLISDLGGTHIVYGRPAGEWPEIMSADEDDPFRSARAMVAGLGDFGGGPQDDFAVVESGNLYIYSGGGLPESPVLCHTIRISGAPYPFEVLAAGDIDNNAFDDILLTSISGNSWLILGGTLSPMVALDDLARQASLSGEPELTFVANDPVQTRSPGHPEPGLQRDSPRGKGSSSITPKKMMACTLSPRCRISVLCSARSIT